MKTVFFDLFETLITEKTRREYQLRTPLCEILRTTQDRMSRWWLDHGDKVMTGKFPDSLARISHIRDVVGSPLTDKEIAVVAREYESWKKRVLSVVDAQVYEMLSEVRAKGLGIGIISNAMPNEVLAWDSCPLRWCNETGQKDL